LFFLLEDLLVELPLEHLVGEVDTQLLEGVAPHDLEAENI